MSVIKKETIDFRRVGAALIGGDFTGNARGTSAIDIQAARNVNTEIASGANSIAIGRRTTASDNAACAIGYLSTASSYYTIAIGMNATASGGASVAAGYGTIASSESTIAIGSSSAATNSSAIALGENAIASGNSSVALGANANASATGANAIGRSAVARIANTTNIHGAIIQRKDNGEAADTAFKNYGGVEDILLSKEVDMKAVADHTITLSANCHFWLNEVGIIATNIVNLVAQPTVRYGITGDLDKHGAAAATTALTATLKREIETPLVPEDGETSLTGGVTIAANADTFLGRFYWKGMLVEDE